MKMMQLALGAGVLSHAVMIAGLGIGAEIGPVEHVDIAFDESHLEGGDSQTGDSTGGGSNLTPAPDRSVVLQCVPVAAYWTGTPKSDGMPQGPELAIVSTEIRPKDARIHLDQRFVGRARYIDGTPGYLYLEPGAYLLEIHLGGYQSVLISLDAQPGCRYDLRHRLTRVSGTAKEKKGDPPGKGEPFHRVFGPAPELHQGPAESRGPDPVFRRDLAADGADSKAPPSRGGALRLHVSPETAQVSIDGAFVATGLELQRMESALATTVGQHRVVVTAPGYSDDSRSVDIRQGETLEVTIELSADNTTRSD